MMRKGSYKNHLPKMMFLGLVILLTFSAAAQEDPEAAEKAALQYMQEAEEALADNDMATAEAFYRKAIAKDPENAKAKYNLGNLYYNKEITGQALDRHRDAAATAEAKPLKHDAFHNQGNAYMKQKKYSEAVEAYKQSLRNNPQDDETRYNLALAKKMLEEEKKQGGGGDKKEEEKQDQQKKQDQKDQQQQGEGEQDENKDGKPDNKEGGDQKEDENKEGDKKKDNAGQQDEKQKEQDEQQKQGEQPREPQRKPGQLSPQQIKNLLEAMGNEEKKVQEKINAKKTKGVPVQTEKDW